MKSGFSYYTAETFIQHLGAAKLGDELTGTLQILMADPKRIHIHVVLTCAGKTVVTLEQMLLHVDAGQGRVVFAPDHILARLLSLAASQANLPIPPTIGRHVGHSQALPGHAAICTGFIASGACHQGNQIRRQFTVTWSITIADQIAIWDWTDFPKDDLRSASWFSRLRLFGFGLVIPVRQQNPRSVPGRVVILL